LRSESKQSPVLDEMFVCGVRSSL